MYGDGVQSTEWAQGECAFCFNYTTVREVFDGTTPLKAPRNEQYPLACKDCIPCTTAERCARKQYERKYA